MTSRRPAQDMLDAAQLQPVVLLEGEEVVLDVADGELLLPVEEHEDLLKLQELLLEVLIICLQRGQYPFFL